MLNLFLYYQNDLKKKILLKATIKYKLNKFKRIYFYLYLVEFGRFASVTLT